MGKAGGFSHLNAQLPETKCLVKVLNKAAVRIKEKSLGAQFSQRGTFISDLFHHAALLMITSRILR